MKSVIFSNLGLTVLRGVRMKFYESCSFFGISLLCQRFCVLSFASAKERYQRKAARETFLARKVSCEKGFSRLFQRGVGHSRFGGANASPRSQIFERSPLASAQARTLRGGFCFLGLGTK